MRLLKIEESQQQSYSKVTAAIIATFAAVWIFGMIPILIRWSENEISPNATMFNRLQYAPTVDWNTLIRGKIER